MALVSKYTCSFKTLNYFLVFVVLAGLLSSCGPDLQKSQIYIESGVEKIYKAQHKEALEDFNKAIKYNPDSYEAYYLRGSCMQNLNDLDAAMLDYHISIQKKPDFTEAYFNLAMIFDFRQQKDSACFYYKKAEALGKPNIGDYTKRCP